MAEHKHVRMIELVIQGDEQAYCQMVDLYGRKLYAYALSLTRYPSDAQDIIQEVFLSTWKHRSHLDVGKSLNSYLHASVYNQFVNLYRKKSKVALVEQRYVEHLNGIINTDDSEVEEHLQLLSKSIEKLPPKCKEVFILNKKEGLSHSEISSYLQISVKAVEAHITKAYIIIRKIFNNSTR